MTIYQDLSAKSKKYVRFLFVLLVIGVTLASFSIAFEYMTAARYDLRQTQTLFPSRQISVTGKGEKDVKPDVAVVTLGVVSQGRQLKDVQDKNSQKLNAVTDFVKSEGVAENDLKTTQYDIEPQYQYYSTPSCYAAPCPPVRPPEITAYQIQSTLEIKVRDLKKVDEILAGVIENGANEIQSTVFKVDDADAVMAEARALAIKDAEEKAEKLAKDLGVHLGKIMNFNESGPGVPGQDVYGMGAGMGVAMKAAAAPSVQPGEQNIKSEVTIGYEIK